MTTQSKGTGGFWLKVIFWLVIIILAFMYIRSLAKNPQSESTASTNAVEQEVVEDVSTAPATAAEEGAAEQSGTTAQAGAETDAEAAVEAGATSDSNVSDVAQQAPMESAPAVGEEQAAAATQAAASSDSDQSSEQTTAAAGAEAPAVASRDDSASATANQQVPQSIRDLHAESVSKILKEFDELRDAARAEMEAMRNLMQAERELQEAMASPPPRPAWPGRGYTPYGGYPPSQQGYTPYYPR
ncbi:MAG: hypothetical protein AB2541_02650 [Candidatus Thiodiazotropha sp.]